MLDDAVGWKEVALGALSFLMATALPAFAWFLGKLERGMYQIKTEFTSLRLSLLQEAREGSDKLHEQLDAFRRESNEQLTLLGADIRQLAERVAVLEALTDKQKRV